MKRRELVDLKSRDYVLTKNKHGVALQPKCTYGLENGTRVVTGETEDGIPYMAIVCPEHEKYILTNNVPPSRFIPSTIQGDSPMSKQFNPAPKPSQKQPGKATTTGKVGAKTSKPTVASPNRKSLTAAQVVRNVVTGGKGVSKDQIIAAIAKQLGQKEDWAKSRAAAVLGAWRSRVRGFENDKRLVEKDGKFSV